MKSLHCCWAQGGSPIRWRGKRRRGRRRRLQGETRTRHARHGEATDLRDDPAWWRGSDSDAGKRPTTNDQTTDQSDHCTRYLYLQGRRYDIYGRLEQWGYAHASVCHSRGEYARDEDGDGFHEVHVNTMGGLLVTAEDRVTAPASRHFTRPLAIVFGLL